MRKKEQGPALGYGPRVGFDGPFVLPNGTVLYYDPKLTQYWDPNTGRYISQQEAIELQSLVKDKRKR